MFSRCFQSILAQQYFQLTIVYRDVPHQLVLVVKNPPVNGGDAGLIPVSGSSPEEGTATHSSIAAWRRPRAEEPGGLQSTGSQSQT